MTRTKKFAVCKRGGRDVQSDYHGKRKSDEQATHGWSFRRCWGGIGALRNEKLLCVRRIDRGYDAGREGTDALDEGGVKSTPKRKSFRERSKLKTIAKLDG